MISDCPEKQCLDRVEENITLLKSLNIAIRGRRYEGLSSMLWHPTFPMSFSHLSKVQKEIFNFIHFWWFAAPKSLFQLAGEVKIARIVF